MLRCSPEIGVIDKENKSMGDKVRQLSWVWYQISEENYWEIVRKLWWAVSGCWELSRGIIRFSIWIWWRLLWKRNHKEDHGRSVGLSQIRDQKQ